MYELQAMLHAFLGDAFVYSSGQPISIGRNPSDQCLAGSAKDDPPY